MRELSQSRGKKDRVKKRECYMLRQGYNIKRAVEQLKNRTAVIVFPFTHFFFQRILFF